MMKAIKNFMNDWVMHVRVLPLFTEACMHGISGRKNEHSRR